MIRRTGMTGVGRGGIPQAGLLAQFDCLQRAESQVLYDRRYGGPRRNQVIHSSDMSYWEATLATAAGGGQIAFQGNPDAVIKSWLRNPGTAGPASMRVEARLVTGSPAAFRLKLGSTSPDFALTAEWQEYSWSATVAAGGAWGIANGSDGAAKTIEVRKVYGELAAAPGAYEEAPFDGTLGASFGAESYDPAWTARGLDFGNARKFTRFLKALTFGQSTMYALCKWNGTQFGTYSTLVGAANSNVWDFGLHGSYNDGTMWPRYVVRAASAEAYGVNLNDGAWHVLAATHDGSLMRIYLDGVEVASKSVGAASATLTGLLIGGHTGGSAPPSTWLSWPGEIGYVLPYGVAHTAAEVSRTTRFLEGEGRRRGIAAGRPQKFVVVEGDSFSETSIGVPYGQKWPYLAIRGLVSVVQHRNYALSGRRLDQMLGLGPETTFRLAQAAAEKNVFLFWGGPNDMGAGAATVYGRMRALAEGARAAGFNRVVTLNLLPKHDDAGYNAVRSQVNDLLAADHGFVDALVNVAADPVMGLEETTGNATYYYDGWHPAAAGHVLIAARVAGVLETVL
ncbi:MAG: LamG-like jellyroll fold domain-containing protein [Bryobacteraceae bacterium]